jgi:alkaline phosphatase
MIYDYLAFDKACGVAFDFARKNGETLVIILADHGNSGISLGSSRCPGYGTLTKDQLFSAISRYKLTAEGLEAKLKATEPGTLKSVFKQYTDIDVTNEEYNDLLSSSDYDKSSTDKTSREKNPSLNTTIKKIMTERTCFGFTTGGHTGEEVLLSAYHPKGMEPRGLLRNFEINDYLCEVLGLKGQLEELTTKYFAKHSDVFNGYKYNIIPSKQENGLPSLTVKNKMNTLTITPNTNIVTLNKKTVKLNSVIVYVDKNNTFYLPRELKAMID